LAYSGGDIMLVVLVLLGVIWIILLMFFAVTLSTLRVEVVNLNICVGAEKADARSAPTDKTNNYKIYFRLYLFNKIRWFSIKINDKKVKKFEKGKLLKWIDRKIGMKIEETKNLLILALRQRKKIFSKNTWEYIKMLDIKLSKLTMNIAIGTENAITVSYLTAFVSAAVSILLAFVIEDFKKEKYSYKVIPLYKNQNLLKMELNCIINVKMVHIMSVIMQGYTLLAEKKRCAEKNVPLKRRSDNKYGASNRRTYGHSYGQY